MPHGIVVLAPEVATPFGKRTHGVEPVARGAPTWVVERVVGVTRLVQIGLPQPVRSRLVT